jgi:hypothetical protein
MVLQWKYKKIYEHLYHIDCVSSLNENNTYCHHCMLLTVTSFGYLEIKYLMALNARYAVNGAETLETWLAVYMHAFVSTNSSDFSVCYVVIQGPVSWDELISGNAIINEFILMKVLIKWSVNSFRRHSALRDSLTLLIYVCIWNTNEVIIIVSTTVSWIFELKFL